MSDSIITHITEAEDNIFLDLGFSTEQADQLNKEADRRIQNSLMLKKQLAQHLEEWIKENRLKQREASQILEISRERISDIVNHKLNKFTIDYLVDLLGKVGKTVHLSV